MASLAAAPAAAPPVAPATASLSAAAGSSTRKRYLQRGQSIFLPIIRASRIGTSASQLGHACLKPALIAMTASPSPGIDVRSPPAVMRRDETNPYLNRRRAANAKGIHGAFRE